MRKPQINRKPRSSLPATAAVRSAKTIDAHLITSHRQPEQAADLHPSKIRQLAHSLVKQYIVLHDVGSTPTDALQFQSPSVKKNIKLISESSPGVRAFAQKQNKARQSHTVLFNPLKPELNPICYLLALFGAHHFLHVSRIRVKLLTFRLLMSCIYGAPILDVSRSHTTTQHSR